MLPASFRTLRLLAALNALAAGFALLALLLSVIVGRSLIAAGSLGVVYLVIAVGGGATAWGLFRLKPWGRTLQIVQAAAGLLAFPVGTVLYAYVLHYLFLPGVKLLFSGEDVASLRPDDEEIEEARAPRPLLDGALALLAASLVVVGLGVLVGTASQAVSGPEVTALASPTPPPSTLATPEPPPPPEVVSDEAAAIADLRAIARAEAEYRRINQGFYDGLDCLVAPARCIPGGGGRAPLLAEGLQSASRHGYAWTFHAGPPVGPEDARVVDLATASPTSIKSFAVTAVPEERWKRSFCVDILGLVCEQPDRQPFDVNDGRCPQPCRAAR